VPLTSPALAVLAAGSGGSGGGGILGFLPLILIVLVGYFLLIRPARQRQRRALENRSAVEPGIEVITTAGLIATVTSVDEDGEVMTLEIAPGVNVRFVKSAIARVVTPLEPEPEPGEHEAINDPEPTSDTDTTPPGQTRPEQND
jgi:preprotein translocase subunit YajC